MADFTGIYAKSYKAGSVYDGNTWKTPDTRTEMRAGYKWSDNNWVMCIKLILPTAAKSLTFSFCNAPGGVTKAATLRYKFTTAEDASLHNATSNIPGDGSFTVNPGSYARTTVTIEKKLAAGTHYVYIWTDNSAVQYNVLYTRWYDNSDGNGFYGSYEELVGCVYIDNGDSFYAYECYIDNGSSWEQYTPHIDNGTNWDVCG